MGWRGFVSSNTNSKFEWQTRTNVGNIDRRVEPAHALRATTGLSGRVGVENQTQKRFVNNAPINPKSQLKNTI